MKVKNTLLMLAMICLASMAIASAEDNATDEKKPDMSIQWGGSTPSSAAKLNFDTTEWESFYTQGANNWYYINTNSKGKIVFEIIDIDSDDDLDLYVYNSNFDLKCSSDNGGNSDEYCEVLKTTTTNEKFYILVIPYTISGPYAAGDIRTRVIQRTCSEISGTSGSCGNLGDTRCDGTEKGREVCTNFDGTYCWYDFGNCASDEYCSSGQCLNYECMEDDDCSSSEKCSNHNCVAKECGDFTDTTTSCSDEGASKKELNVIYQCNDQIIIGKKLCWEKISSLGDGDFCSLIKCDRNEYDCDSASECNTNYCTGPLFDVFTSDYDGCCYSNEEWDTNSKTCKRQNGQSCTADSECYGGYCLAGSMTCWNQAYKPDDGYCDSSKGETCSNSQADCGICNGQSCSANSACQSKKCVHDICRPTDPYCGDGFCDSIKGETPASCSSDCYGNLKITKITQAPSTVNQGQTVTIKAKVKNSGTYQDKLSLEASIVPSYWEGEVYPSGIKTMSISSVIDTVKCCPGNDYYDAVNVTLNPGEETEVTFSVNAPTIHSTDACSVNPDYLSAWDSSHKIIIGLYKQCKGGYVDAVSRSIKVNERYCVQDSQCWTGEECSFASGVPGVCVIAQCHNQCSQEGIFSCSSQDVKKCTDINHDGCLELVQNKTCYGDYICVSGQSQCQLFAKKTKASIDYANKDVIVNKQPGDILTLRLKYAGTETITLDYNASAFTLLDCSPSFIITSNKACKFNVNAPSQDSLTFSIGVVNGQKSQAKIIRNPQTLIVTDKAKLIERFGDTSEVKVLMEEAYVTALKENGIVYDLGDYLVNNLWNSQAEYPGGDYAIR